MDASAVIDAIMKHPAISGARKVLEADAELGNKIWGYSPEQIGNDVLERTGSPVAATAMHMGRELATPLNAALSLYSPVKQGVRGLMSGLRPIKPGFSSPVPESPVSAPESGFAPPAGATPNEGFSRRDLFRKGAGAAATVVLAKPIVKALEHLAPADKQAAGKVIDELAPKTEPTPGAKAAEIPKTLPDPKHIIEYGKGEGPMIPDEFGQPRPFAKHIHEIFLEGPAERGTGVGDLAHQLNEFGPMTKEQIATRIMAESKGELSKKEAYDLLESQLAEHKDMVDELAGRYHGNLTEKEMEAITRGGRDPRGYGNFNHIQWQELPYSTRFHMGKDSLLEINPKHTEFQAARDLRHTHEAENVWHYADKITNDQVMALDGHQAYDLGNSLGIRHENDILKVKERIIQTLERERRLPEATGEEGKINPIVGRPGIIVRSKKGDDSFNFESDGWYEMKRRHTPKAKALMKKAEKAIGDGTDHDDVIRLLREAGFNVY